MRSCEDLGTESEALYVSGSEESQQANCEGG